MSFQVSRLAVAQTCLRLADPATGFAPRLIAQMADAGIVAPKGWKLPINFAADGTSKNFFKADVSADDFLSTSAYTYPFMTVFGVGSENQNRQKFQTFSGAVQVAITFETSWLAARVLPDFETAWHTVEEAFYLTFNAENVATWATGTGLTYNGEMSFRPSELKKAGENWLQSLHVTLSYLATQQ